MPGTPRVSPALLSLCLAPWLGGALPAAGSDPPDNAWDRQLEADWATQDAKRLPPGTSPAQKLALLAERGLRLAADLGKRGTPVEPARQQLRELAATAARPAATDAELAAACLQARHTVRRLVLANPLLAFDSILFVKRAPGIFPHMSDQHYGWWSRPGGGVFLLQGFKTGSPRLRCLTADLPPGSFLGPELSPDGKRVLFAYCRFHPGVADMEKDDKSKLPADCFYQIYEMNADGSGRRQLTKGRYDDFDARYLPDGSVMFLSTRKGLALQVSAEFSDSTRFADLPDSYVRCGGDRIRPVPVFTLHAMNADGTGVRPLSAFENFEWTPSVAADGRILFTRWDYIDRFNGHFFSLWSANQDGGNPQLVYGNYTVRPQVACEARQVPGSPKLAITAAAHHSITGGSLCLLDRAKGTEEGAPLTRLTPEVCFPETEGWPEHYFANPWPLAEDYFLVSWSNRKLPPHCRVSNEAENPSNASGIYLLDSFGNLELLHRDPDISSVSPVPLAPRTPPPVQAPASDPAGAREGCVLVQDVGQGLGASPRAAVKRLRIVGVPPKEQPFMNNPVLGVSNEDPGKFVIGTVPVEEDGSAFFRLPSGVPVFFQALDEQGVALQTMRSLTYLQPGQTLSCAGCHEGREAAPAPAPAPLALRRPPSRPAPGPDGAWPLRFDRLVQPVLDRRCVNCHRPDSGDAEAAKLDLTAGRAYDSLLSFADHDLKKLAFERDRSLPGEGVCANSRLWRLLTAPQGHRETRLEPDDLARLATWMDTYAHRVGHYSDDQERRLAELRSRLADMLEEP